MCEGGRGGGGGLILFCSALGGIFRGFSLQEFFLFKEFSDPPAVKMPPPCTIHSWGSIKQEGSATDTRIYTVYCMNITSKTIYA